MACLLPRPDSSNSLSFVHSHTALTKSCHIILVMCIHAKESVNTQRELRGDSLRKHKTGQTVVIQCRSQLDDKWLTSLVSHVSLIYTLFYLSFYVCPFLPYLSEVAELCIFCTLPIWSASKSRLIFLETVSTMW